MESGARGTATNPAVYQAANDRIVEAMDGFIGHAEHLEIMCECSGTTCNEMLRVERGDYEAARNAGEFLVLPHHVRPGELAVHCYDDHWTIVTPTGPAQIAEIDR